MTFVAETINHHQDYIIDSDIDCAVWMSLDEIIAAEHQLRSDMVLSCIEDYRAKRIFPLEIFRNKL
jgi:hypothetical protein